MVDETKFEAERRRMVREQLARRGIHDQRVLEAMETVPRHAFVEREHLALAYADGPLPIGHGQTISQPYIVALMSQLLELEGNETVLEVGTGSGYQAAVLSRLVGQVHTVERIPSLARYAAAVLLDLGCDNVHVHEGDGSLGWGEYAPYGGILVTAAAPSVPQPLLKQLAEGARLVIPVGPRGSQYLEVWLRQGDAFLLEVDAPVAFVPLLGKYGWD